MRFVAHEVQVLWRPRCRLTSEESPSNLPRNSLTGLAKAIASGRTINPGRSALPSKLELIPYTARSGRMNEFPRLRKGVNATMMVVVDGSTIDHHQKKQRCNDAMDGGRIKRQVFATRTFRNTCAATLHHARCIC